MKRERVVVGSADRVNGEARATSKNLATDETQIEHGSGHRLRFLNPCFLRVLSVARMKCLPPGTFREVESKCLLVREPLARFARVELRLTDLCHVRQGYRWG